MYIKVGGFAQLFRTPTPSKPQIPNEEILIMTSKKCHYQGSDHAPNGGYANGPYPSNPNLTFTRTLYVPEIKRKIR